MNYRIDWRYIRDILIPDLDSVIVRHLLLTIGILLALVILRWGVRRLIEPRMQSRSGRFYLGKVMTYLILILGLWSLARIWLTGMKSLGTIVGLLSAGMAIALKDPLVNLAGFFAILVRRPFRIGQRIQIGDNAGDVVDIRSLHFTLLEVGKWVKGEQSTGRLVHIPNGLVFTTPVINFQGGFDYLWNELTLELPADVDWQKIRDSLLEVVCRHAETDEEKVRREIDGLSGEIIIRYPNLKPIVYVALANGTVTLTARYLYQTRHRRATESRIYEDLLRLHPELIRILP
jgi:small-conductance mechanosensitive channel